MRFYINKKDRSGFIFSLDAILALVICTFILMTVFFYFSHSNKLKMSESSTQILAIDTLAVLDIDGSFQEAIEDSSIDYLKTFLNTLLHENICMKLKIKDSQDSLTILEASKTGCTFSEHTTVARRTLYIDDTIYIAEARAWNKNKQSD